MRKHASTDDERDKDNSEGKLRGVKGTSRECEGDERGDRNVRGSDR